jgi:hypothetical protein
MEEDVAAKGADPRSAAFIRPNVNPIEPGVESPGGQRLG